MSKNPLPMVSSRFAAVALVLLLVAAFVACAQGRGGVPRPIDFAIRPATTSVPLGADLSLRVIATYQGGEQVDLTGRCEWTASPSGVATVGDTDSAKGVVTGLAPGSATITARDPASRSVATAALTVTPAAVISVEVAALHQPVVRRGHRASVGRRWCPSRTVSRIPEPRVQVG